MARITKLLHEDWSFHLGDVPDAQQMNFKDDEWEIVNLPHDWSIKGKFTHESIEFYDQLKNIGDRIGYLPQGIGWYRKSFNVPKENENKITWIQFDGVYRNADVWINGQHLGFHPYGYTSFYYDLTPYLNYGGSNVIVVRVNNYGISSRWYAGSGIYRKVTLTTVEKIHVVNWGTYITTPSISEDEAEVRVRARVVNETGDEEQADIIVEIEDQGNIVTTWTESQLLPLGETDIDQMLVVKAPMLWSTEDPHLYTAKITIMRGSDLDVHQTIFGIRSFKFDPDNGFSLNGKSMKIKGVCLHHDNGCIGAVEHERAISRKLRLLREMGCNAIRTSHNPPSVDFLDACDKEGFLVMAEAYDEWTLPKTPFGYWMHFNEKDANGMPWHERDIRDFVHRDRNHPSIILWSVGNEVPEQTNAKYTPICKRLVDIYHEEDPTRPVTSGSNNPGRANETGYSEALDVVGYNYYGDRVTRFGDDKLRVLYDVEHETYPTRCMIGSENVSNWMTRGVYKWPYGFVAQLWKQDDSNTCSNYDLTSEVPLIVLKTRPYVSGMFVWEGFDYIGEPTPYSWPGRSSNYGIIDLAGFPKDSFYLYQSMWTDKPMVHLFPHWNWHEGMTVPIWIYTNCEAAELVLNGRSLGMKKFADLEDPFLHLEWEVPYEPGELTAIAKNGDDVMATKTIKTTKTPYQIKLEADWTEIAANGVDIAYLTASILDIDGNVVPTADNIVVFTVKGPGVVIGVDNGNNMSHEPFNEDQIHAFNGLCLAMVQSTSKKAGEITIVAASPGLIPATVMLIAKN